MPPFVVLLPEARRFETEPEAEAEGDILRALEAVHRSTGNNGGRVGERFAVRSSARGEDGALDSHAGQFLTLLEVPRAGLVAAAARVFASGRAVSVAAYRAARGRDAPEGSGGADGEALAVVVQSMVAARSAGVAFAADPVSGRRDRVVVCAVAGLGDQLVAGAVDGETWVLAPPALDVLNEPSEASCGALTRAEAGAVARLCLAASAARGAPQDIEWAYGACGTLFLLQSRPITSALLPAAPFETALLVFDNSNIQESYPGLVAPLTFSFAVAAYARVYRAFLALVGVEEAVIGAHAAALANMVSRLDGRLYYNLGNWYRLLSLLRFFARNQGHMETMMGVAEPLPAEAMIGAAPPPGSWAKTRMVARLAWAAWRLRRTQRDFLARVAAAIPPRGRGARRPLETMPLSRLAEEYRRIEAALLDRSDAPIINDFLCMMAFGASRGLMARWGGAAGLALHNDVMIGQGDIISAEPARLIRAAGALARTLPGAAEALATGDQATLFALPGLGALLTAYLETFGDRRIGELKLEQPTPARVRTGTACGGVVTGTVRVIRDPWTESLLPGEILVARHTDPGWICHFAHAAAVVVERGSVLSHSAIVSRELGIPCVVALPEACTWLTTGARVRVDGSLGTVRKLDTPEAEGER